MNASSPRRPVFEPAAPTFTADVTGVYVASLTVLDDCGPSLPAVTIVSVANHRPTALAGPDQEVMPGNTVSLDGSGSTDPDHDALHYSWSIAFRPAGSAARLASATAPTTQLVPDLYGTYVVLLVVDDGLAASAPAEVTIAAGATGPLHSCATAALPVGSAGPDQTLSYYGSVQLDGSGSTTGRPVPLTWKWQIVASPAGSRPSLDSATAIKPVLSVDRRGAYKVSLVVNDGCLDSAPAVATITKPDNAPSVSFFGTYQAAPLLVPFTLQGSAYDQDNDPLT